MEKQMIAGKELLPGRTVECRFPLSAKTGRAFITPCCTSGVYEFFVDGELWLAGSVAGHGWNAPWKGSIDDINDTGTKVDANGAERRVYWRTWAVRRSYGKHRNTDFLKKWDVIWVPVWTGDPKQAKRFDNMRKAEEAMDTAVMLMRPAPWCVPDFGVLSTVDIV